MTQWKCRDGRVMDIKDMETKHLSNSIALLRSRGVVTMEDIESLKVSYPRQSPQKQKEIMEAVKGLKISEVLGAMEAELLRRFLSGESLE